MKDTYFIAAVILVQLAGAFFFVSDILPSLIGFRTRPISWQQREIIEIGAAVGLLLGLLLGALALRRSMQRQARAESQLRLAIARSKPA